MIIRHIIYNNFSYWRFNHIRAEGSYIWDDKGNRLIDFTSGWNVTNLGWNNREVNRAMVNQIKKNTYASMWSADPIQEELAAELIGSLPKSLTAVSRATGGTEANEQAMKTVRGFTGRKKIIGFKDTYHGESFGTLALGYLPEYAVTKAISPLVGGIIQIDFPKEGLDEFEYALEKILAKKDVAGIVTEASIITGWGSAYVAPKGYLSLVRRLTKKYGSLLILDEVGTGFSRCGKLFGMDLEGVVPDIVTFAKGMSNGQATIGAMVTTEEIARKTYDKTNLTSTFGWVPVSCAAALKTLKIHKRDKVWAGVDKKGKMMRNIIYKELKETPFFNEVRGVGLEIGLEFVTDKKTKKKNEKMVKRVLDKAFEKGLHLTGSPGDGVVQIMPPLTTPKKLLEEGLEILTEVVKQYK